MLEFWLKGPKHRIYFIIDGSHETPQDLAHRIRASGPEAAALTKESKLKERKPRPESWKKLTAVIQRTLTHGVDVTSRNPTRCKCFTIDDGAAGLVEVREVKADDLRIMFFKDEPVSDEPCTSLVITHCFKKKQDATPANELTRFCNLRRNYYNWRNDLGAVNAVQAYALQE